LGGKKERKSKMRKLLVCREKSAQHREDPSGVERGRGREAKN